MAAIQQPLLFLIISSIRTFHQTWKKVREMLTSSQRVKISFTTQSGFFYLLLRASKFAMRLFFVQLPPMACVPAYNTVKTRESQQLDRIVTTQQIAGMLVNTPLPQRKRPRKIVGTRGRKMPSRSGMLWSIHADFMQILRHWKSHILSRRYKGKITVPTKQGWRVNIKCVSDEENLFLVVGRWQQQHTKKWAPLS